MQVTISIVSWNVCEQLRACLKSIEQFSVAGTYEIIVVDNASADGSAEMVRQEFPNAVLIANTKNNGFGAANNQALAIAKGDYFLCLNDDCMFTEDVLGKLVTLFPTLPDKVGMLGVQLRNSDGSLQPSVRRWPTVLDQTVIQLKLHHLFPKLIDRYLAVDFDYSQSSKVEQVMGAFMFIPTKLMQQLHGFDEAYFVWFEEVDLQKRLQAMGYLVRYESSITCMHAKGQSFQQLARPKAQAMFNRSLRTYMRKQIGLASYLWFTALAPISMLLAYVTQGIQKLVR